MYSKDTLNKYIAKVREKMNEKLEIYRLAGDTDSVKKEICFSKGNRKIGRVHNVSTAPIITCHNCSHCSGLCYDIKAAIQYKNVMDARARNTVIATEYRKQYFDGIREYISHRRTNKYFRWHVGGEIIDYNYFCEMVETAKMFPNWYFWTYTKMHGIVNLYVQKYGRDAIPENFTIMFSEWDGMPLVNPYNFPVFTCKLKEGNKNHPAEYFNKLYHCPGNCDICKKAHTGCIAGMDTYADEH